MWRSGSNPADANYHQLLSSILYKGHSEKQRTNLDINDTSSKKLERQSTMTTVDKNSGVEFSNTMYQWKAIALVSIVMAHSWYTYIENGIYCFHQIVINCVMRSAFNKVNLLQWGDSVFGNRYDFLFDRICAGEG